MTRRLRPSASHIWTKCPAYPAMIANVPEEEPGDPAREGTCAAWVAEMVLLGHFPDAAAMVGESHENGWVVEPDMAHYIQKYIDRLRAYGGGVEVERRVRLTDDIEGTPDGYAVIAGTRLYVDDLKYGYVPVDPYRNTQVGIYAAAIMQSLALMGTQIEYVRIGIYQPRAMHPQGIYRTWELTPQELWSFAQEIITAGERTKDPNAPCITGEHCLYCEAASTCATLAHANAKVYEHMGRLPQRHLTPDEMSAMLDFITKSMAMLEAAKRGYTAETAARISNGEYFPGWGMEQGYGQRRFTQDADVIRAFTGVDPMSGKLCTPLELERRGADPEIVKQLTQTPRTKPSLKRLPEGYYANMFKRKDRT